LARRARIALLSTAGVPNTEITRRVGGSHQIVMTWWARYAAQGIHRTDKALLSGDRSLWIERR
jgi:transposase